MTGIAMLLLSGGIINHTLSSNPASLGGPLGNGVAYSENCTVIIIDGIGPFTVLWSIVAGTGFSVANSTALTCTVSHAGANNIEKSFTLRCVVTDTGNDNFATQIDVPGDVVWGTP